MTSSAGAPAARAAKATAWAWLPALAATTPAASSASGSRLIAFVAPRALNEPVSWRFSALSTTRAPSRRDSSPAGSTGVSRTAPGDRAGGGAHLGLADLLAALAP